MIREFFESLRRFVEEICCAARERAIPFPKKPWRKYRVEVEDGQLNIRHVETDLKPDLSALFIELLGLNIIDESKVFGNLIKIIARSEKLSQVFMTDNAGNLLPKESGKRWVEDWVLSRLLPIICVYLSEAGGFDFFSQVFDCVCGRIEREIKDFPHCRKVLLCPLIGIHLAEGCCFQLENDLWMRPLSPEEMEELLNEPVGPYYTVPNFSTVIEVKRTVEAFKPVSFPLEDKRIDYLVTTLRLLSGERVFVPFQVKKSLGILKIPFEKASGWSLEQRIVPMPNRLYTLDKRDCVEVKEIYERVSELFLDRALGKIDLGRNLRKRVTLALRKWSESLDQISYEWKLLASWIALEALFSPSNQGELSFRLALRAATFLGQKKVYQDLKDSYKARSSIVHGVHGRSSTEDAKFKRLALATEKTLSQVLRKILWEPRNYVPDQLEEKLLQNLATDHV